MSIKNKKRKNHKNIKNDSFFAYSWYIDDDQDDITIIRIYGLDKDNKNVCVIVNDFTPYVYIELPSEDLNNNSISWNSENTQYIGQKINDLLGDKRPITKSFVQRYKLYYAHVNKDGSRKTFPFLFCNFNHRGDIKILERKLYRPVYIQTVGRVKLKMHEQNADPILQLTSWQKLPTAGWINFVGKQVAKNRQSTYCDYEYKVKWKNLSGNESDEVARPLIMSFDCEVNSSIPSAMPSSGRPDDKIFQISCIFTRQGKCDEKDAEFYLLSLGNPDQRKTGNEVIIRTFDTENELLLGFTTIVKEKQPNVMIGYNIFGFDIQYMYDRAEITFCGYQFVELGMLRDKKCPLKSISWSSSAYKNQSFVYIETEGRVFIDMLPVIKRDNKLSNYTLKNVSTHFLGQTKDPLNAKGIFKCYRIGMKGGRKGDKAMGVCGKYCMKDSYLVTKLFEVTTTWIALCEMSKVTNVPIFYLFTKGQQLKIFSQVYNYCMDKNMVVEKDGYIPDKNDHYVGATVFPPIPGVYDRVVPFDFSSLYPTTIIAYNICWSTLVPEDSEIPLDKTHNMEWEDHIGCKHDPRIIEIKKLNSIIDERTVEMKEIRRQRDLKKNRPYKSQFQDKINEMNKECKPFREERSNLKKKNNKHVMCCKRKFRWLKEPQGVLPSILTHLLTTRKKTKKVMKAEKSTLKSLVDDEKRSKLKTYVDVLDNRQKALKISANSVTPDTPIPCILSGKLVYRTIDQLSKGDWVVDDAGNEFSSPKEDLLVWSDIGFTKVKYVFRHDHKSNVKRINTHVGCVDCTEDHSLLRPDGLEVKSTELSVGDELMHQSVPLPEDTPSSPLYRKISNRDIDKYKLTTEEESMAFVYGLFFAEGICGKTSFSKKYSWVIYNKNYALLERARDILNKYGKNTFKISECHLIPTGKKIEIVGMYRDMFYTSRRLKKVPDYIFGSTFSIRQAFFMGYYAGDGNRKNDVGVIVNNEGSIGTSGLMYIAKSLGYFVSISNPENNVYRLQCSIKFCKTKVNNIKKISDAVLVRDDKKLCENTTINGHKSYVYDIETESHHFAAGVGDMIVHNSGYGATGVTRGYLPCMPAAMCTTFKGRGAVQLAADSIQKDHGGKLVYGDSVSCDTPIMIQYPDGSVDLQRIDSLSNKWFPYEQFKSDQMDIRNKEQSLIDGRVWTNGKWAKIVRVIRHKTTKKIYRVLTHIGCIDVTEDHSLLDKNYEQVKPTDVSVGSILLHSFPKKFEENDVTILEGKISKVRCNKCKLYLPEYEYYWSKSTEKICKKCCYENNHKNDNDLLPYFSGHEYMQNTNVLSKEEAFVWGFFMANGSNGKYSWAIINSNLKYLHRAKQYLEQIEPNYKFKIIDTMRSSRVYKLVPSGKVRYIAEKYYQIFYSKYKEKIVPYSILNSCREVREWFFEGYYMGDGYKPDKTRIIPKNKSVRMDCKGKIGTQGLYYLLKSIGYKIVSINTRKDKPNVFRLNGSMGKSRKNPKAIKKIHLLPENDQYVYDIETECGIFHAGIGELVVKNTDSNYISFPELKTAEETWDHSIKVAKEVTKLFPPPINISW